MEIDAQHTVSSILDLPSELLAQIVSHVPLDSLKRLSLVSKQARGLVEDEHHWHQRVLDVVKTAHYLRAPPSTGSSFLSTEMEIPEDEELLLNAYMPTWKAAFIYLYERGFADSKEVCPSRVFLEHGGVCASTCFYMLSGDLHSGGWWQTVRVKHPVSKELNYCEFLYEEENPIFENSWRVICGIVPGSFPHTVINQWIGKDGNGIGYIAGVGSFTNNDRQQLQPYKKGDKIGVLIDYFSHSLSFTLNDALVGIAALGLNLETPWYFAVSLSMFCFRMRSLPFSAEARDGATMQLAKALTWMPGEERLKKEVHQPLVST
jgi:hypothetical protein